MNLIIREANRDELVETAGIYIECMRKDYSFKPQYYLEKLNTKDELDECHRWLVKDAKTNKVFVALIDNHIVGYIAVARNNLEPLEFEGEIAGFFIREQYRNFGIGLMLFKKAAEFFKNKGISKFVVYNYNICKSNKYYRYLGGNLLRQEVQYADEMALVTDIFGFDVNQLLNVLDVKTGKYINKGRG